MTDAMARARDEQLIASVAVVLHAGFTIEQRDGYLRISGTDDGRFLVTDMGLEGSAQLLVHETFDDIRDAVSYYLDLCDGLSEPT